LAVRRNRREQRAAVAARWLVITAAVLAGASGLVEKYWSGAPSWIILGASISAAIVAIVLAYNKSSSEARAVATKWQTDARTLLQIEAATETSQIDPYLIGTGLSRYPRGRDHYVTRQLDRSLRSALRPTDAPYPFILIVGESLCGKTRTAFEAVDAVLPNSDLIVPREGFQSIRSLLDLTPAPQIKPGTVVFWLDDIKDFSAATLGLVARMKSFGPTICTVHLKDNRRDLARDRNWCSSRTCTDRGVTADEHVLFFAVAARTRRIK